MSAISRSQEAASMLPSSSLYEVPRAGRLHVSWTPTNQDRRGRERKTGALWGLQTQTPLSALQAGPCHWLGDLVQGPWFSLLSLRTDLHEY